MKIKIKISNFDTFEYITAFVIVLLSFLGIFKFIFKISKEGPKKHIEEKKNEEKNEEKKEKKISVDFFDEKEEGLRLLIVYASQTGTSEEFGNVLEDEAQKKYGIVSHSENIMEFQSSHFKKILEKKQEGIFNNSKTPIVVCFLLSNYGDGEAPDTARDFHRELIRFKASESIKDLSNMTYVIFGLGNTQYCARYQQFTKSIESIFSKHNANKFDSVMTGYGDSDKYLEEDFEDWYTFMLEKLTETYQKNVDRSSKRDNMQAEIIDSKFKVMWIDHIKEGWEKVPDPFNSPRIVPEQKYPFLSTISKKTEIIRNKTDENTLEVVWNIEIDYSNSRVKYQSGDHCGIIPVNNDEIIQRYAKRLKISDKQMDSCISCFPISAPHKGNKYLKKTSLINVFKYYLDLTSITKKKFVKFLYKNSKKKEDSEELHKIIFLSNSKNKKYFNEIIVDKFINMIDLMEMFPEIEISIDEFLECCPLLQPRFYSIASCELTNKNKLNLIIKKYHFSKEYFSKFDYKSLESKDTNGVSSDFFDRSDTSNPNSAKCYMFVRESKFHYPKDHSIPVIMIANGTGVAAIAGFLTYRKILLEKNTQNLGKALLFFGCRHENNDWLLKEEQLSAKKEGVISDLFVAFSRDQEKKIYVQHLLEKEIKNVMELIKIQNACVYVCGSSAMGNDVLSVLQKSFKEDEYYSKNSNETQEFFDTRYFSDCWSTF